MSGPKTVKELSAAQQYLYLKNSDFSSGEGKLMPNRLTWCFKAQPTPLSRIYSAKLDFKQGDAPSVFIVDPNITKLAGSRKIPHIYHNPVSLCLYLPRKQQWHGGLRLDKTIIPWTNLWLYYFEEWLATDEWKGEGEHPDTSNQQVGNRWLRRSIGRL